MKLTPLPTSVSLKEQIYQKLRAAIVEMNIYEESANLRLDERSMSEQLGISRTPLREALTRLEQEGFLEVRARKGIFVLRKSLDEILDLILSWAALETMAARLCTERASDAQIAGLRRHAMKHSVSSARADLAEYSDANLRFHQMIFEICGSAQLRTLAEGLFVHIYAVRRRAMAEADRAAHSVADHMEIIEAIETRQADKAARLAREHTMRLHDHIRQTWVALEADPKGNAQTRN